MHTHRFYTTQSLCEGQSTLLEPTPSHHLIRVLRTKPGDAIVLFNGDGFEYQATYDGDEKKLARVLIHDAIQTVRESRLRIHIGQAISRGERMDLVMQKSVELGVHAITPLWTRRSQVQLDGKRLTKRQSHWQGIVVSACEQSGRVHLPSLYPANKLREWIHTDEENETRLVLDPEADLALTDIKPMQQARILIGPEGGLEDCEIKNAVAAGFYKVKLGPRILRTETAALATLAAMQTLWGDLA